MKTKNKDLAPGLCTYPYPISVQYSCSFCLNDETLVAETTVLDKEFYIFTILCVKKLDRNWSLLGFLNSFCW